jgi:UDP-glucose 4-epimerase
MQHILVTGSSGYIGSSFIKQYANHYRFTPFSLLRDGIDTINFSNIDAVLHCAALVHSKKHYSYETYYKINVAYTIELAKKAKQSGIKHFIFMSTIAVYDESETLINEESRCNPSTPYGKSKYEAEKQLLELSNEDFSVSILRIPMVYGKDAPGNIHSLISLIHRIPILPFGDISNRRSFIYIDNLLSALCQILQTQEEGVFFLCDDQSLSTTQLIRKIAHAMGKKIYLFKLPFFSGLLHLFMPKLYHRLYENLEIDNTQTKKRLDFQNPYTADQGIFLMFNGGKHEF